jgi:hypothetical protein
MRFSVVMSLFLLCLLLLSAVLYECHIAYGVRQVEGASVAAVVGEGCYSMAIVAVVTNTGLLSMQKRSNRIVQSVILVVALGICGIVASEVFEEHYLRCAHVQLGWECGAYIKSSAFLLMVSVVDLVALWISANEDF